MTEIISIGSENSKIFRNLSIQNNIYRIETELKKTIDADETRKQAIDFTLDFTTNISYGICSNIENDTNRNE